MKLLIIFDKDLEISPEKVCIHVGHSSRAITLELACMYEEPHDFLVTWEANYFKTVLLKSKLTDKLKNRVALDTHYEIRDAGLDGVFEPNTLLGYAVLVEEDCDDFKRLQTLRFNNVTCN